MGESCGTFAGLDGGTTFYGTGGCAQNLLCGESAGSTRSYCLPDCTTQADCPPHANCVPFMSGMTVVGMACAYDTGPGGIAVGMACGATDSCVNDTLCESGTCKPQCEGPGGTCASGTCTAVVEGSKTLGYVCK